VISMVSEQSTNIYPGLPARYTLEILNDGLSDPTDSSGAASSPNPTLSTFLLSLDAKQLVDGVKIYVDGILLDSRPMAFHSIAQQTPFFINVQVYPGSSPSNGYQLALNLCVQCGLVCSSNQVTSIVLTSSFLQPCPGIQLAGELATQPATLLSTSSAKVDLVFNNMDPQGRSWASLSNVQQVSVQYSFSGASTAWTTLIDAFGLPVNLAANEVLQTAVVEWDLSHLGLTQATINVRGFIQCARPTGADPFDPRFWSFSSAGSIVLDVRFSSF